MDTHFRTAPHEHNIPVQLGLMSVWNVSFLGYPARAILPYTQALAKLAPHIQQVGLTGLDPRVAGPPAESPLLPADGAASGGVGALGTAPAGAGVADEVLNCHPLVFCWSQCLGAATRDWPTSGHLPRVCRAKPLDTLCT